MFEGLLNTLVMGIFNVIATLANTFMTPFINAILLIFPDLQESYGYIVIFLNYAFTYLTCIYRWLLFTPAMFSLLFTYTNHIPIKRSNKSDNNRREMSFYVISRNSNSLITIRNSKNKVNRIITCKSITN